MKMTKQAREQFLAGVHVGVIAIERTNRPPFAVAIWYAYEPGGEVSIFTTEDNLKVKLIRAAGRFSVTAQQEQAPYKFVTAEGDVTSVRPADEVEARAVAIRYLGEDAGNRFADANQGRPEAEDNREAQPPDLIGQHHQQGRSHRQDEPGAQDQSHGRGQGATTGAVRGGTHGPKGTGVRGRD